MIQLTEDELEQIEKIWVKLVRFEEFLFEEANIFIELKSHNAIH